MEETFASKIRAYLDAQTIKLQKTEHGTDIDWPCYVSQVDFIKDFMCAVSGYPSIDDAPDYKKDTMHDLACDIVDKITSWRKD